MTDVACIEFCAAAQPCRFHRLAYLWSVTTFYRRDWFDAFVRAT